MNRTPVVVLVSMLVVIVALPAEAQTSSPGVTLFRGDGSSAYRPTSSSGAGPGSSEWIAWERPRVTLYPERESPYPFVRSDRDVVRLEMLGGVNAPLGIDLTLRLAIAQHLLITASAGVVTFGGAARTAAMGYVSEEAANSALLVDGALMLRVGVGARIVDGLEIVGGYAVLHRELTVRSDFLELLGVTGITGAEGRVTLQAVWAEIGWTFTILEHFLVRPAIGVMHVLDASASLVGEGLSDNEAAYLDRTARTVETYSEQYGTSPTLSLTLGYRL
jgi:hypothetical protein